MGLETFEDKPLPKVWIPTPNWIKWDRKLGYVALLSPLICLRCYGDPWYPRIKPNGSIELNMCPHCKSKFWWKDPE